MDVFTLGMQALEAAIHTGSDLVNGIDHIVQAVVPEPGDEVTCEACRCTW